MWVRGLKRSIRGAIEARDLSHPVWVRGLKRTLHLRDIKLIAVAPRVGAWIETILPGRHIGLIASHPVWVRGLKRIMDVNPGYTASGRTPCGCVD